MRQLKPGAYGFLWGLVTLAVIYGYSFMRCTFGWAGVEANSCFFSWSWLLSGAVVAILAGIILGFSKKNNWKKEEE